MFVALSARAQLVLTLCLLASGLACGAAKDTILEQPRRSEAVVDPQADHRPAPVTLVAADDDSTKESTGGSERRGLIASQSNVAGRISHEPFNLPHAIVLRGLAKVGDSPDTVVFLVSDQPELCAHLQAGTLPRNSRMLAVALVSDRGFAAGTRFLPGGDQGEEEGPMATAYLRALDQDCRIDPALGRRGAMGVYGFANLLSLGAEGGRLSFRFEMENDAFASIGTMAGEIAAPMCDAPLLFEHAVAFFEHKLAPGACQ